VDNEDYPQKLEDNRTEIQTEHVPVDEEMVDQTKPLHRQELDNTNPVEKLHQALPKVPEVT